jgi:hypothetical protein
MRGRDPRQRLRRFFRPPFEETAQGVETPSPKRRDDPDRVDINDDLELQP